MKLTSSVFQPNSSIPPKYTCDGQDVNPSLTISAVPAGAKSLVLIIEDPDVPKHIRADGMWDHWIVFNVLPDTSDILEGQEPMGTHGRGTARNLKYHGPCPPDREHRYFFKLYALDAMLDLPEGATKTQVEETMEGHVLEQADLIGQYARK